MGGSEYKRELKGGGVTSNLSEAVIYCVHQRENWILVSKKVLIVKVAQNGPLDSSSQKK